jgi:hypothetical protein
MDTAEIKRPTLTVKRQDVPLTPPSPHVTMPPSSRVEGLYGIHRGRTRRLRSIKRLTRVMVKEIQAIVKFGKLTQKGTTHHPVKAPQARQVVVTT